MVEAFMKNLNKHIDLGVFRMELMLHFERGNFLVKALYLFLVLGFKSFLNLWCLRILDFDRSFCLGTQCVVGC